MRGAAARVHAAWAQDEEPSAHPPKFSFEYFPPKTAAGVEALYPKVYRMVRQAPLFVDLTWGAGGSTSDLTLQMSTNFKRLFDVEVNMHLTCTNITKESVERALVEAKQNGLTSICALRGDPPAGSEKWTETEGGFDCALDLVRFIRKEHGDYFSVAVSGYPEGHPNVIKPVVDETKLTDTERSRLIIADGQLMVCSDEDYAHEIRYLKKKVEAGGNFIITQLFFDPAVFLAFVDNCRAAGITVPIIPGIMALGHYAGLKRMIDICKTRVPDDMRERVEELKGDDEKFVAFGIEYVTALCKRVWESNKVPSLHFYCLNQYPTVFQILTNLGIVINPLDSAEDQAEVARVTQLIKETTAQKPKREASDAPREDGPELASKRVCVIAGQAKEQGREAEQETRSRAGEGGQQKRARAGD